MPFVQALIVGATPKPFSLLRMTLFNKYDLPVLYIPATPNTTMGPSTAFKNWVPSFVTSKSPSFDTLINCTAFSSKGSCSNCLLRSSEALCI